MTALRQSTALVAWGLAVTGACSFALGVVGAWGKEFAVWIPRWLPDLLVLAGLALSFGALVTACRLLFTAPPPDRRTAWRLAGTLGFAALGPAGFLLWWCWMNGWFAPPF